MCVPHAHGFSYTNGPGTYAQMVGSEDEAESAVRIVAPIIMIDELMIGGHEGWNGVLNDSINA